MSSRIFRRAVCLAASLATVASFAVAGDVVSGGKFSLTGTLALSTKQITFGYKALGDQTARIQFPDTGAFSRLQSGEIVSIRNLNASISAPVTNWIELGNDVNINVDLTGFVTPNIGVCSASASYANGSVCRLTPNSGFLLEQASSGVTASLSVRGVAHYDESDVNTQLVGLLSANFTDSSLATIAKFVSQFNKTTLYTSYSGNFSTVTPEPTLLSLLGGSLIGLGTLARRRRKAIGRG